MNSINKCENSLHKDNDNPNSKDEVWFDCLDSLLNEHFTNDNILFKDYKETRNLFESKIKSDKCKE